MQKYISLLFYCKVIMSKVRLIKKKDIVKNI